MNIIFASLRRNRFVTILAIVFATLVCLRSSSGEDPIATPKPVPHTRTEIKAALDKLKMRKSRLPVPSASEMPAPVPGSPQAQQQSQWGSVTNGRARKFYLPDTWFQGEASLGSNDSKQLVDYKLKTECFWIVSRGNNCHYCLGHQEHKLHLEGLNDDALGALDRDWSQLDSRTRKAVMLARKMTLLPTEITDSDVESLKPEFDDKQIVELVYTIARFNATNRWTDSLGLPQDDMMRGEKINFKSPTAKTWDEGKSLATPDTVNERLAAPTLDEIKTTLGQISNRKPRVALCSESETKQLLQLSDETTVNHWHQAIATLAQASPAMVRNLDVMLNDPELSTDLKLQILWTTARNNRGWFALSLANQKLLAKGWTQKSIDELIDVESTSSGSESSSSGPSTRMVLDFATKLTNTPHMMTDGDIAELRKDFTDRQTAQIVHVVCVGNALDRFTETLGL